MKPPMAKAISAPLLLCLTGGCYHVTNEGNATIYQYSWWVSLGILAIALLLLVGGRFLFRTCKPSFLELDLRMLIAGVLALGAMGACLFAPASYHLRIVVDDDHFERRTGFLRPTINLDVHFQDLARIEVLQVDLVRKDRAKECKRFLVCISKTGEETIIEATDLVERALDDILARATARGVPIHRRDA
jgi:hypothetical protein